MEGKGDVFSQEFEIQPGEVVICAEFPKRKDWYAGLVSYTAR